MTEILFYHLEGQKLEGVLLPLLEKSLARGWRVVVHGDAEDRIDAFDAHLWTYSDDSFLPHGTWREQEMAMQPVLLTVHEHNPNAAQIRFVVDGAPMPGQPGDYQRIVVLFDGADEAAVATARTRWSEAKSRGFAVTYWQPDESGRWRQKA
jgi:DNA polymerase IIIc chi subunit